MTGYKRTDKKKAGLAEKIGSKADRKLKAQQASGRRTWFGLGLMGLVGWSIAVPAVIGTFAGIWIDRIFRSRFSWTLMLLIVGVLAGCLNIWYWLSKEADEMRDEEDSRKGEPHDF